MLDMKLQKGWWAKFILQVFFPYYSLSIFSKYSLMFFPFIRKCKSLKIIFTSSAATSSMAIQSGCYSLWGIVLLEKKTTLFSWYTSDSNYWSAGWRNELDKAWEMCNSYLAAVMSSLVTDKAVNVKRTLMRNDIDLSASVISTTAFKIN